MRSRSRRPPQLKATRRLGYTQPLVFLLLANFLCASCQGASSSPSTSSTPVTTTSTPVIATSTPVTTTSTPVTTSTPTTTGSTPTTTTSTPTTPTSTPTPPSTTTTSTPSSPSTPSIPSTPAPPSAQAPPSPTASSTSNPSSPPPPGTARSPPPSSAQPPPPSPRSSSVPTLSPGPATDTLQALLNPVATPTCSGSANYTQPSSLESTQGVSGNVCSNGGLNVPGYLNASTFNYQFTDTSTTVFDGASTVTASVGGRSSTLSFQGSAFNANTGGYNFAVQGKNLSVVLNGKNVSVPLFGSAAPTASPIVSTASASAVQSTSGRRLLASLLKRPSLAAKARARVEEQEQSHPSSGLQREEVQPASRQLLQAVSAYTISVQYPCGGQVNGLVNGYTATNLSVPLSLKSAGLYQGTLNVANTFPDLIYATSASIAFCNANKANIQASCSSQGASFSNSNTLLNSCSQFLTNGEVSAAADPQQVSVACSVVAVQVALICRTQSTVDCTAAARATFQLAVQASAPVTVSPVFATIFQGALNGQQGATMASISLNTRCNG